MFVDEPQQKAMPTKATVRKWSHASCLSNVRETGATQMMRALDSGRAGSSGPPAAGGTLRRPRTACGSGAVGSQAREKDRGPGGPMSARPPVRARSAQRLELTQRLLQLLDETTVLGEIARLQGSLRFFELPVRLVDQRRDIDR